MPTSLEIAAEMKAAAEVEVQKYTNLMEAIVTGEKAAEDRGFDMGVQSAGTVNAADKLYSEEELQAELQPLKDQVAALQQQIADIGDVDAKIAQAVKAEQLSIAAQIEDANVDDMALAAKLKA